MAVLNGLDTFGMMRNYLTGFAYRRASNTTIDYEEGECAAGNGQGAIFKVNAGTIVLTNQDVIDGRQGSAGSYSGNSLADVYAISDSTQTASPLSGLIITPRAVAVSFAGGMSAYDTSRRIGFIKVGVTGGNVLDHLDQMCHPEYGRHIYEENYNSSNGSSVANLVSGSTTTGAWVEISASAFMPPVNFRTIGLLKCHGLIQGGGTGIAVRTTGRAASLGHRISSNTVGEHVNSSFPIIMGNNGANPSVEYRTETANEDISIAVHGFHYALPFGA